MSACKHCGDYNDHSRVVVAQASCAYRHVTTEALREHAIELGADPVAAADLLAHLRAVGSDPDAYATARYVLDLGWRPIVGASK